MKERFSALEVIEMAKDIEIRGKNFYLKHAEGTENKDLEELFRKLASDEQDHYERFSNLAEQLKKNKEEAEYLYDEEVSAYFKYLVDLSVFPESDSEESQQALHSVEKALKLAIQAEKDSILFYREMCDYNEGKTIDAIKTLIGEEKQHFKDLTEYAKRYK